MPTLTPTLVPLSPGSSSLPLDTNDSAVRIGRAADLNDVVLKNARVSRLHCKVFRDGYFVYIVDYSTNGTVVNGTLLNNNLRVLGEGEVFEVGGVRWRLEYKRPNQVYALENETNVSNFDTVGAV
jgi:pSer/pThr/pTyr-binding forkhead associated (FHA) protein